MIWEDKRFSNYIMLVPIWKRHLTRSLGPCKWLHPSSVRTECDLHTALLTCRFDIYWQQIQRHPSGEFSSTGWIKRSWTRFRNPLVPCLSFEDSWVWPNPCHPASQCSNSHGSESPSPPESFSGLCSFLLPFIPGRDNQNLEFFTVYLSNGRSWCLYSQMTMRSSCFQKTNPEVRSFLTTERFGNGLPTQVITLVHLKGC